MKITFDTFLTQLMISAFFYPKTLFFVLFIFIFIFFTIIYLLYRHHKQSFSPDECLDTEKGILETFPDGYYYWLYDSIGFIKKTYCSRRLSIMLDLPQGLDTTFDVFAGRFTHQSVDILNTALNDMRQDGSPFRIEVQTLLDSRSFLISGFRTLTPKNENTLDVLWVRETTQTVKELSTLTNIAQKRKRQNTLYIYLVQGAIMKTLVTLNLMPSNIVFGNVLSIFILIIFTFAIAKFITCFKNIIKEKINDIIWIKNLKTKMAS